MNSKMKTSHLVTLLLLTLPGAALAQSIATAGEVSEVNHGKSIIWQDENGRHLMVGGDPAHGIYRAPNENASSQSSIKCSDTA